MSLAQAQADLDSAAADLAQAFRSVPHDLWTGRQFNVAPTRLEQAERLRAKGEGAWDARDFDYVLFKAMTTMGGEPTFRFVLPRFLAAFAADPYAGFVCSSHVLVSKVQRLALQAWRPAEVRALATALAAFASLERQMATEAGYSPDADTLELLALANALPG